MMNSKITFITNIPSPYNLDLYDSLSKISDLDVYFYTNIEIERQWIINLDHIPYKYKIFKKDFLFYLLQKINRNLYFNFESIQLAFRDKNNYIILSGNYFSPNNLILSTIYKLRKKKVFWYGESIIKSNNWILNIFKYIILKYLNILYSGVFAVGEKAIRSYQDFGITSNIYNTPYSIKSRNNELRKEKNDFSTIKFLSSGSLITRKGHDIVIEAFNLLNKEQSKKVELTILGDGPELRNLLKIIKPHIKVNFIGFVQPDEINKYFQDAHIFIIASRYDGWGVVINEALAYGLPVIVSNSCGASEYIKESVGFVINPNSIEIFNKLLYFINNIENYNSISNNCFELANQINSDVIANKIYNILKTYSID